MRPASITDDLRLHGHDVLRVRDVIDKRTPGATVIAKAQELGRILLSLNGDFSDIVAYPPASFGGIIAIQLHNHPEVIPPVMSRLHAYLQSHPDRAHYRGKLFLAEPHRIRIRT